MTTDHQGAEALKPCPWCGSTDMKAFNYTKPEPDSFVQCYGCTTIGPSGKSEDEARAAWNRRPAPADQERAERLIEVLRIERDTARAQKDHLVKLLTSIHAMLYPGPITTPEGRTYVFTPPQGDAQQFMQRISELIREIPEKLADVVEQ